MWGDIFGAIGSVAGAAITADAISDATKKQIEALERQRAFVFSELDPAKINTAATAADVDLFRNRLALQAMIDPSLSAARFQASDAILRESGRLGADSPAAQVADVAAREAVAGTPGMDRLKQQLIDNALAEIEAGATLPPDVQAELVQTGLEKSGMVTGAASPKGLGGTLLRKIIGEAGINLQAQRQERAAKLAGAAQSLESERQNILQTLFPNLSTTQLNQLQGQQRVLEQANLLTPQAGLSGQDIANIWLARVGATNQLAQSAADAAARGGMGVASAWQSGLGSAVGFGSRAINSWENSRPRDTRPLYGPGF